MESRFAGFPIRIEARIPESRVYDLQLDPKGYVARMSLEPGHPDRLDNITEVENLVVADGDYSAILNPTNGQIWAFDELQEIHRVNVTTGEWFDSTGQPLGERNMYTARGLDPMEASSSRPLNLEELQQRQSIRSGSASPEAAARWPELARAEEGPAGSELRRLWSDESGEKVVPGGAPVPPRRGARGKGAQAFNEVAAPTEVTDWDIEMADLLNSGEGTTQRLDGRKPPKSERYIVSPNKNTETIFTKGEVTPVDVAIYRELHGDALGDGYFGAWVDGDDVYMDVSRGFTNKGAAMDVAMAGDQRSIADLRKIEAEDWDNAFPENPHFDEASETTIFPNERMETETRVRVFEHMPELEAAREANMLRSMSPSTRAWFDGSRSHIQDRVREMHRMQLPKEDLAALMAFGQQTRGWYKGAAGSIGNAFGQDSFQFAALLAATSPNVPVPSNTRFALDLWAEWNQWGRPKDPEVIQQLFDSVAEGSGIFKLEGHQVVPNANLNTIEVLSHPEPVEWFGDPANWARGGMLSGAKVDPFFANVIGELDRMTVDTHQLKYIAAPDNSLSRRAATEAGFTEGAEELARQLDMPEGLQVAEGQEMSWEFIRQLSEMSGRGRGSAIDVLFDADGNLRMENMEELERRMEAAQDFSQLMESDEARALIEAGGGDPNFEAVQRTGVPDPARAREIALGRPGAFRRAGRRLDMVNEGDYLMQAAPWLVGGAGAGLIGRHLDPNAEQPPQPGRPQGLFDGATLPFVGR